MNIDLMKTNPNMKEEKYLIPALDSCYNKSVVSFGNMFSHVTCMMAMMPASLNFSQIKNDKTHTTKIINVDKLSCTERSPDAAFREFDLDLAIAPSADWTSVFAWESDAFWMGAALGHV